jgi:hypothetical protein
LIRVQNDLKLWNKENRVKRTPFWSILKSRMHISKPLTTL